MGVMGSKMKAGGRCSKGVMNGSETWGCADGCWVVCSLEGNVCSQVTTSIHLSFEKSQLRCLASPLHHPSYSQHMAFCFYTLQYMWVIITPLHTVWIDNGFLNVKVVRYDTTVQAPIQNLIRDLVHERKPKFSVTVCFPIPDRPYQNISKESKASRLIITTCNLVTALYEEKTLGSGQLCVWGIIITWQHGRWNSFSSTTH